jgi:hypothetical protein
MGEVYRQRGREIDGSAKDLRTTTLAASKVAGLQHHQYGSRVS